MFFGGHDDVRRLHVGHRRRRVRRHDLARRLLHAGAGHAVPQALENYFEKIDRCKPVIDVGFHIGVTDLEGGGGLEALAKLPDEGITSYKLFMAYKGAVMVDDETLFKSMQVANETGGLVMVHAENGDAIDVIVKEAVAAGKSDPIWHARTAPMETEAEATNRAISSRASRTRALRRPRLLPAGGRADRARPREGLGRLGETCTQYLFIDDTALEKPNWEGAKYIYTPPPRPKAEQEHLWKALQNDVLSVVSTDHCPFNWPEQKGINGRDFQVVPNGGPGIENRLHMLHEFGVRTGRITMNRFVELTSTNVAKRFGLYPRKGTIAGRQRRRPGRLGSREGADDLGETQPLERQLQPVRGHEGDRRPGGRARPRPGDRRERRARRRARARASSSSARGSASSSARRKRSRRERQRSAGGLREGWPGAGRHARLPARRPRDRLQLRVHGSRVRARLRLHGGGRADETGARRRTGEGPAR
jgi:hypothetical protein